MMCIVYGLMTGLLTVLIVVLSLWQWVHNLPDDYEDDQDKDDYDWESYDSSP